MNGFEMETIKVSKTKFIDSAKIQEMKDLITQISKNNKSGKDMNNPEQFINRQEKLSIITLLNNTLLDYQTYASNIVKLQADLDNKYNLIYKLEYDDPDDDRVKYLYDEAEIITDNLEHNKKLLKDCVNRFEMLKKDTAGLIPYRMPRLFKGGTKRKNKKRKKTRRSKK
jgi:hypothetical protein